MESSPGLGFLLRRAYYSMRRRLTDELAPLGLTAEQYSVIYVLEERESLPQQAIAERLFSDPNTVVGILRRLEEAGWITRAPDPGDRRVQLVRLTPRGRRRRRRALEIAQVIKDRATEGVSQADMRVLRRVLGRIYENSTSE